MRNISHVLEQLYVLLPLVPVAALFFCRRRLSYLWTFRPLFAVGLCMSLLILVLIVAFLVSMMGDCTTGGFWGGPAQCEIAFFTPVIKLINPLTLLSLLSGGLFVLIGIPFLLELLLRRRK